MRRTFLALSLCLATSLIVACDDEDKEVGANPPDSAGASGSSGTGGSAGAGASGGGGSAGGGGSVGGAAGQPASTGGTAGSGAAGAGQAGGEPGGSAGVAGSAGAGGTGCGGDTPPPDDCNEDSELSQPCGNDGICVTTNCVGPDDKPVFYCSEKGQTGGAGGQSGSAGSAGQAAGSAGAGGTGCGGDKPPPDDCNEDSELSQPCGNGGTCVTTNCVGPDDKPVFYCSEPTP